MRLSANILISGSTGFLGSALGFFLTEHDAEVVRLVRGGPVTPDTVHWEPGSGQLPREGLEGFDAVVHLAGENIAHHRWTNAQKTLIRDSRVQSTRLLAETLAKLKRPPGVFICASASGFYGDRGEEILTENSSPGTGFLAEVCRDWEAAAEPARKAGIRTVHLRFGMILSPRGGALARMTPLFKTGLGGRLGSGQQWCSWIGLEDACRIVQFVIRHSEMQGPVNVVSPQAVTNGEFTAILGRVLHHSADRSVPHLAVKLAMGEMADALFFASARVRPDKLLAARFDFQQADLESALARMLAS